MPTAKLSIHSENILPIIKKWLYSEKEIFLRELVSNACDAISKLKILNIDIAPRIDIRIDKKAQTISIEDNGIGMTKEEVEKYIAQIAFSGAQEFIEKYKTDNFFIGHFGLGFFSAYMVAKKVEIQTLSYEENQKAVFWSCDGSSEYLIEEGSRAQRGTTILLHLDNDNLEFLEEFKLKELLSRYCPYLSFPIYLNDKHINNKEPLWIKNPSECSDKEYLDFYKELYPIDPEPILWVHLNVDFPFHLKGILYFPKTNSFDVNKHNIKLFQNRVFVSDNCQDFLPDYLTILKGALDSSDLPLNVSRSYLQVDSKVRQIGSHIAKKLSDRLSSLYQNDKEKFISNWPHVETIVKLGILQDEKFFERCKNFLIWKTLNNTWITLDTSKPKIFYTHEESSFLNIYKEKNIEVLIINPHIDIALITHLERLLSIKFQRIDGAIDDSILDPSREKTLLDPQGKTYSTILADFIHSCLPNDLKVEAKSLSSNTTPAFILLKEEDRRFRDYMQLTSKEKIDLPVEQTFIVNTNNNLINSTYKLSSKHPDIAKSIINQLYQLSLFSQKELPPSDLSSFISSTNTLLENLIEKI